MMKACLASVSIGPTLASAGAALPCGAAGAGLAGAAILAFAASTGAAGSADTATGTSETTQAARNQLYLIDPRPPVRSRRAALTQRPDAPPDSRCRRPGSTAALPRPRLPPARA